uniref:Uncharacterized protein n=1 Tax=Brassica oleracea var. oleracea TaxID=109376 RepID=A0A0D3CIC2_BRAOL
KKRCLIKPQKRRCLVDTCCPLRAPFSLSRNASLLVIFARIFFAEIDTEIQRDEEIVDGDGKDIGARDGVGTAELESGFGRITTSNPSPGRERLAQSLREMVECSARHQKVGEKPLMHVSTFVQLWNIDDCYIVMGRDTYIYYWYRQRNKCHGWTSGYGRLSSNAKPSLNAENWPLVIVVSVDTCCPLFAPFSLSRNASLLVIFARIFFAEIDTEIQRDEEIVDGDGKDIGARDGVGTAELESGFGRITTSNPSPGRERLAQSLRELVECSVCRSKLVSRARHQKVGEKPLMHVSTFVQLWNIDDCYIVMGRDTYIYYWYRQRNKCHGWTSGYGRLSSNAKPSLNAENWPLVIVVS